MNFTYLIIILDEEMPSVESIEKICADDLLLLRLEQLSSIPEKWFGRIKDSSNEIISFGYGNFFAYKLVDKG